MAFPDEDAGRVAACPKCRADVDVPVETRPCAACGRRVAADARTCPACAATMPDEHEMAKRETFERVMANAGVETPRPAASADAFGPQPVNGKAMASLALGLMSFVFFCVTGVPAMILGLMALGDIRFAGGRQRGRAAAVAGVVLGALSLVLLPLFFKVYVPGVMALRASSVREECEGNLTVIGMALGQYHDKYGSFPPVARTDASGRPLLSWRVLILPFLGEGVLFQKFHLDESWDSAHNLDVASMMPEVFRCPTKYGGNAGFEFSSYVAITGDGTVFPPRGTVKLSDITDGLATTAMIVEVSANRGLWTAPDEVPFLPEPSRPGQPLASGHSDGAHVLMADGTVRFLDARSDAKTLSGMSTISGKEIIDEDSF